MYVYLQVDETCVTHVYNTLLELYLSDVSHEEDISKRVERERKTLDLLQNEKVGCHALVFSTHFRF